MKLQERKKKLVTTLPNQPNASNEHKSNRKQKQRCQRQSRCGRQSRCVAPKRELNEANVGKQRAPQPKRASCTLLLGTLRPTLASLRAAHVVAFLLPFTQRQRATVQSVRQQKKKCAKRRCQRWRRKRASHICEWMNVCVCVWERVRARASASGSHLKLCEKFHKMSDALFLYFCLFFFRFGLVCVCSARCAAVNIFFVLLLPGDS